MLSSDVRTASACARIARAQAHSRRAHSSYVGEHSDRVVASGVVTDRGSRSNTRDLKPRTLTPTSDAVVRRATDSNAGRLASTAWLSARGLRAASKRWDVEVGLGVTAKPAMAGFDPDRDTCFQLFIYSEEWGFRFCHARRQSWIRVTDIPFVHGRDAFGLLAATPPLKNVGAFLRSLESEHRIKFQRAHAAVSTTLPGAEAAVRKWLHSL